MLFAALLEARVLQLTALVQVSVARRTSHSTPDRGVRALSPFRTRPSLLLRCKLGLSALCDARFMS